MNSQQLRQTLECPVCFHVRSGSVYVCKRGHWVCVFCFDKLPAAPTKLCPMARCAFDNPPRRNLAVEQIIAGGGVALDCSNADHGCLVTGAVADLEEHKPECPHREVPCIKTDCSVKVRLPELENHIARGHMVAPITEHGRSLFTISWDNNRDWAISQLKKGGMVFYKQLMVRGGLWFAWTKVKGGAKEAAKWSCDVSVGDIVSRNQQVHPVDRTVEEVLETGNYLALTMQQVRKIARGGERSVELCVNHVVTKK